jgi:hypothetical protein
MDKQMLTYSKWIDDKCQALDTNKRPNKRNECLTHC